MIRCAVNVDNTREYFPYVLLLRPSKRREGGAQRRDVEAFAPLLSRWIIVLLAILLDPPLQGQSSPIVYVTNSTSNTVSVVDVDCNCVIARIPTGVEPFGLAFSQDGKKAYVANAQSQEVTVVDTLSHQPARNIPLSTKLPVWVGASPDGSYIYVTNEGSHDVAVIAAASEAQINRIRVGRGPAGIAISSDGRYGYVANEGTNDVSCFDLRSETVTDTVPVGSVPQGIVLSPNGSFAYVANFGSDSVSVISTVAKAVVSEIPVAVTKSSAVPQGPVGIAVSPDGERIYTGNFKAGTISVIDVASRKPIASVFTGAETFGVAVDALGKWVFAVSGKDRQISVVDPVRFEVINRIKLDIGPFKLAVLPETKAQFSPWDLWPLVFFLSLSLLLLQVSKLSDISPRQRVRILISLVFLAFWLRLAGLDWGIPVYDAATARSMPGMRVSFHMDENNFLWNLTRVRPESLDFYVQDFHWRTLQYHLVEVALLLAEELGIVSKPWREVFLNFQPDQYYRLFVVGRAISAILGSCSIILVYAVGKRLYSEQAGIWAALTLAVSPLAVLNSHYLTSDITMSFFLLLTLFGLCASFERSDRLVSFGTGVAFGLAVTAKYNAFFMLPAFVVSQFLPAKHPWSRKVWLYPGAVLGFIIGEPYALTHRQEFWETLQRYYLSPPARPEGAVPEVLEVLGIQLKNMAIFGLGLPLSVVVAAMAVGFFWTHSKRTIDQVTADQEGRLRSILSSAIRTSGSLAAGRRVLLWVAVFSFLLSLLYIRQPMLRYTLPVVVLLVVPIGHVLSRLTAGRRGRVLVTALLLATAIFSFAQVRVLTQEHTVNQAFEWIESHVPVGSSIIKGWPEMPVLNIEKYQVSNFYTRPRVANFDDFFTGEDEQPFFPDYVLLDNLPTFDFPGEFLAQLDREYWLVAEFRRRPQFLGFVLPEWNAPHDWKYSHPEIRIYRKKQAKQ